MTVLTPLAPNRVLLELVEAWISSFHTGALHLDGRMTCKRGSYSDEDLKSYLRRGSDSLLPGECRAADRGAPAAPACTPHLLSHDRPSSSSSPSWACLEDTDLSYKPGRDASSDSRGSCCLKLWLISLGSADLILCPGLEKSPQLLPHSSDTQVTVISALKEFSPPWARIPPHLAFFFHLQQPGKKKNNIQEVKKMLSYTKALEPHGR